MRHTNGQLNDRDKWQPFKIVFINSRSQGVRAKRLAEGCRLVDIQIAKIFGIDLKK